MTAIERLRAVLSAPVDPAGFLVFRVGFGLICAFAAARFVARGWVEQLLLMPEHHFFWLPGMEMPPEWAVYALFAVQFVAGVGVAFGVRGRLCLIAWLLSFGFVELLDKTLYLNHYVLMTMLGVTLLFAPPRLRLADSLPAWVFWTLRVQLALVYFWAGVAKLNTDWLLHGEPLTTWLEARADLPLVGSVLAIDEIALAMSWAGAAYDLTIPALLLWPRTRPVAFLLVLGFHVSVGVLFPIGIFPVVMILGSTLFFPPSWPRRWMPMAWERRALRPLSAAKVTLWAIAIGVIAVFPGRSMLVPGHVGWHERGHRFAWRVMLIEKTGMVDFTVIEPETGRRWRVMPADELTPLQHKQMRTQPDMIRDYALHLKRRHAQAGRDVEVYADAWASLNGRPAQRLLRDDLDLTLPMQTLNQSGWIVPLNPPSVGAPDRQNLIKEQPERR
ncbi:MAG: HTTM domain-containing protein [Myxococcota bacterium]